MSCADADAKRLAGTSASRSTPVVPAAGTGDDKTVASRDAHGLTGDRSSGSGLGAGAGNSTATAPPTGIGGGTGAAATGASQAKAGYEDSDCARRRRIEAKRVAVLSAASNR